MKGCSKVLVTGGAGFIGSHLVDVLMVRGFRVGVVDNLSSGGLKNVESWLVILVLSLLKDSEVAIRSVESIVRTSSSC